MIKVRCLLMVVFILFYEVKADTVDNTLIIGSSLDLSRGIWTEGYAVQEGINAVFAHAHIPGIQLKLDARDDQYMPDKARDNIKSLLNEHIDILLMPMGSETFQSYLDIIKEGKILALFPTPGSARMHDPSIRYCIYLRPSYFDQAAALSRYVINKLSPRPKKVILFYQDDAFGKACLAGAKSIFEHEKIATVDVLYERNNMNLSRQAELIKSFPANALGLFCTAMAAKDLLSVLGDAVVSQMKLFAIDDVWQPPMKKFIGQKGLKIIMSNVVPNPETSDIALIKEYRSYVKDPDTYSLESFIAASIFVDILQKLRLPITKEKIIHACEAIKNYKFKEFPLNFNPKKRQLIDKIWINSGRDEWEKVDI